MKSANASNRRAPRARNALTLAVLATLCAAGALGAAQAAPGGAPVNVARATTLHGGDAVIGALPMTQPIRISVALKLRDQAGLDAFVAHLAQGAREGTRPAPMTSAQFLDRHAPTQAQAKAVADYLASQGFRNIRVSPNRTLVSAEGTAATARNAFMTQFAQVKTHDGRIAFANTDAVRIPAALGDTVLAVVGLQNVHIAHTFARRPDPGAVHTMTVQGHFPTEFPSIYGVGTAAAATDVPVGIITEGKLTQTKADLAQFATDHGLPAVVTKTVNTDGTSNDTAGTGEWDLDSQDIVGISGGVSKLIFYNIPDLSTLSLLDDFGTVVSANETKIINVSLGLCELSAQSDGSAAADDVQFQVAVAQGQTFSISTGDSGADECGNLTNTPSWPAASQYVVAAAGTRLNASTTTWTNETVWTDSGGSASTFEPMPDWQTRFGVSGTTRVVADIAFDGDPNSGAIIQFNGSLGQFGGTSLSAPLFAGLWARVLHVYPTVGFAGPVIYALPSNDFHDITGGTNSGGETGIGFHAAAGYDFASGRGSMKIGKTVTDVGTVSKQLVKNGDFEKGSASPWTLTPSTVLLNNASRAHTGSWLAEIGNDLSATDKASQTVTVTAGKHYATLRFFLHTTTTETTTTMANDTLSVQVFDTNGNLLSTLHTFSNLAATSGYVEHDSDMSAFIGQTIVLKFIGVNNGTLSTKWDVDDVTLTVL